MADLMVEVARYVISFNKYTVVGVYDDTGEVYSDTVEAAGPHEAMAAVAKTVDSDLQILGAFEGEHSICCASEDSGKSAWAVDLAGDE